jgi:hypothetical protein
VFHEILLTKLFKAAFFVKPVNMMNGILCQTIDWSTIDKIKYKGDCGIATWQTLQMGGLRLRLVEYSANYSADHWCKKGHIVHRLEGEFESELQEGKIFILSKGMTYVVSDNMSTHRSTSKTGVKLLIIDGDFLTSNEVRL